MLTGFYFLAGIAEDCASIVHVAYKYFTMIVKSRVESAVAYFDQQHAAAIGEFSYGRTHAQRTNID